MTIGDLKMEALPDNPKRRQQVYELEDAIQERLPGPQSVQMNGWNNSSDDIYLATSWLHALYTYVRALQGDTTHEDTMQWADERCLAAICNRLGLDYEAVLEADPMRELELIHDGLEALDVDEHPGL